MGCGSSVAISEDPEKFPTYLLFQFTSVVIKTVSLQRNDQLSKEHVFQIKLELYSAQMDILGVHKSEFYRLSKDNCSLQSQHSLFSMKSPLEFWKAADAGKACFIKIGVWSRQVRIETTANSDKDAVAQFVGDALIYVGGPAESDGYEMFCMLQDTERHRIKVETMSPLLLSTREALQRVEERVCVLKDELNTQVIDLKVRIGSCNRSVAELESLLDQHMMEALHQRRLAQKLLHIVEYAEHHAIKAPFCSPEELQCIIDSLKASKKTVERTIIIKDWSEKVACSCNQIGQVLAVMRYDEERATALAHLVMRCSDGHKSSELLSLCNVFDTDAKLESAFHHVSSFYSSHCIDHGSSPKSPPVSTLKRGGSNGSGSDHDGSRSASSSARYSPAPAISRNGSHSSNGSSSEQDGAARLSRQPSSAEP